MAVFYVNFCIIILSFYAVTGNAFNCPLRDEAFELITGYVFTSPDTILDTRPGVLKLEDCITVCKANSTCVAVNYETGLCVLFSTSAEETPGRTLLNTTC